MKDLSKDIEMAAGDRGVVSRDGAVRLVWFLSLPAFAILLTAFHYSMASPWKHAAPELMADFEAAAPFQYRLLLPAIVAALRTFLPVGVETLFAFIEVAIWILLVVAAHRALVMFQVGGTDLARRILAMTILIPVAMHLIPPDLKIESVFVVENGVLELGKWHANELFHYMYDLPAAAFILGLVLLLRRFVQTLDGRWFLAYLALFTVATVNRETTVFMIPAFLAVCYPVLDRGVLARAVALQVVVFGAIQLGLQEMFADNINPNASVPGTQYENHLIGNLALFANPLYLIIYLARFSAGLYLPVLLLHRYLDSFLARVLLWYGVPFIAATLLFGRLQEHRVLIEITPLLWLGAMQAMTSWLAVRVRAGADPRPKVRAASAAVVPVHAATPPPWTPARGLERARPK